MLMSQNPKLDRVEMKRREIQGAQPEPFNWGGFIAGIIKGIVWCLIVAFAPQFLYKVNIVMMALTIAGVCILNACKLTVGVEIGGELNGFFGLQTLLLYGWGVDSGNAYVWATALSIMGFLFIWTALYFLPCGLSKYNLHTLMRKAWEQPF